MGIVQTLVTVGGVLAIIGLLALLFCHYLGGWTWTKAWLRSSREEKMVLTRAGTHQHFNPNGYMVPSESDLNLSGRGSFRRFDTTDTDYQLFRQGSNSSLRHYHQSYPGNNYIPPQPLRPAPIPPSLGEGRLNSESSLDSVFNTAPVSPSVIVPKIPPPPPQQHQRVGSGSSLTSVTSHATHMGDGNNERDRGGGGDSGVPHFSSTNPFLPLLQASSNFFTQTMQSFQSGLQQQPQNVSANIGAPVTIVGAGQCQTYDDLGTRSTPVGSLSSVSTIGVGSGGISMGEILFSAPPSHSDTRSSTSNECFGINPSQKHVNSRPLVSAKGNSGSPQHTRYSLHQQNNSGENTGVIHGVAPAHSPPPIISAGIRRASYPNRKEYTPHDTIPKSEFPQHIPYIPSMHHNHHLTKGGSAAITINERKVGVATDQGVNTGGNPSFNDPLRLHHHIHHHYLPSTGASGSVQPFLEEQEEPPEEPYSNHQLPKHINSNLDQEKEDLTNRIMLETMREEIRIANERMADATKSLMMDDVFLPTSDRSESQRESPRKRNFSVSGSLMFSAKADEPSGSISGKETGKEIPPGTGSSQTLNSQSSSMLRRSSTPNAGSGLVNTTFSSNRPTTLIQQENHPNLVNTSRSNGTHTRTIKQNSLEERKIIGNYEERNERGVKSSNDTATNSGPIPSASQPLTESIGMELHSCQMPSIPPYAGNSIVNVSNNSSTSRVGALGSYFKQNSRSFSLRQSSTDSIGSDGSDLSSPTDNSLPSLQRAMSCDSVSSDTSVILGDLDPPHMTGHLCIGLEYDSETADLLVNVMEGKELVGPDPDPNAPFDSYVRVYLLPDKTTNMQTRIYRKSSCPAYKEKFMFGLEISELAHRSLVFYLYATDKYTNTLIGEAELKLAHIDFTQPVLIWLLLTDTGQRGGEFGEIMFSLSYLPTAERLTVVVVKGRNLKFPHERETGDPFVKVYLLQKGKKVSKKKSSTKRGEKNPIFNEAMIFSIPAHALQTIQLRITVADSHEAEGRAYSVGHVIVGSAATGKPLSHWNQMLSSLRKPIAMWHALRK